MASLFLLYNQVYFKNNHLYGVSNIFTPHVYMQEKSITNYLLAKLLNVHN